MFFPLYLFWHVFGSAVLEGVMQKVFPADIEPYSIQEVAVELAFFYQAWDDIGFQAFGLLINVSKDFWFEGIDTGMNKVGKPVAILITIFWFFLELYHSISFYFHNAPRFWISNTGDNDCSNTMRAFMKIEEVIDVEFG